MEKTRNIINKLLNQTQNSLVKIKSSDDLDWKFYSKLHLNIPNSTEELFYDYCEKYLVKAKKFYAKDKQYFSLTDESFEEKLIFDLLQNLTALMQNAILIPLRNMLSWSGV